jgi:hypothetical protein
MNKNEFLPEQSENRIQAEAYLWFHNTFADLRGLLYHVPNGEYRDHVTASKLKAIGVVSGIPDIIFHYKGKTWFFEFKASDGVVSKTQKEIHAQLTKQGFTVYVVRSVEDFQEKINFIVGNDTSDPLKIGLNKKDYFYRHKVFEYIYTQVGHNKIIVIDDIVDEANKIKFTETVKDFIRYRFDELDNFEILFTNDYEAFYRRDNGRVHEPIFYKGKSIPQ